MTMSVIRRSIGSAAPSSSAMASAPLVATVIR